LCRTGLLIRHRCNYLALANVLFVSFFLLFAGPAGQIADRFSKTRVLQITKLCEIAVMIFGTIALIAHNIAMSLAVLFCVVLGNAYFWLIGALVQNTVLLFRIEVLPPDEQTAGFLVGAVYC